MAREVGLKDMYHSVMIPASSALHGDWSALDEYVLDRCRHALHDGHAVPRAEYASESEEQIPDLVERFALWAFDEYCSATVHEPITDEQAQAEMRAQAERGMTVLPISGISPELITESPQV